jgi:hypothetical protein
MVSHFLHAEKILTAIVPSRLAMQKGLGLSVTYFANCPD